MKDEKHDKDLITWGSHVFLHKAVFETFDIKGAIELGAGNWSTKLLRELCDNVVSVESDKGWIEKLKRRGLDNILYQKAPGRFVDRSSVSIDERNEYVSFVDSLITDSINLLFIDCVRSMRYDALSQLYTKFDIVTFHDYQQMSQGLKKFYNGGFKPNDSYEMLVDETFPTKTGIIIKKTLANKIPLLKENLVNQVKEGMGNQYVGKLV